MFGQTLERKDRAQHRHFWRGGGTQVKIHIKRMNNLCLHVHTNAHVDINKLHGTKMRLSFLKINFSKGMRY